MKNEHKKQLAESIDNLTIAFHKVLDAIELDSDFDTFISDDYPFELSFDEQYIKVIEWKNTMDKKFEDIK